MPDPTQVRWTESATRDLRRITRYIRKDNSAAARAVAKATIDAAEALAHFPLRGREGKIDGTRELVVSGLPYIVVYKATRSAIQLLHVYHGARNYPPGQ
jgi:addiction module RelE/StbE family toxin